MQKKTVISVMVVSMLLVIALYFISGTYARYTSSVSGVASLDVAKWAVSVKSGGQEVTTFNDLQFTVDSTDVVAGKIAPSITATAEVDVDLTGTEVSVDIGAEIDQEKATQQLQEALGDSPEDVKVTASVEGFTGADLGTLADSGTATISLPDKQAFTGDIATGKIKIAITWTNNEDHNTSDTSAGEKAPTLTIPITLEVKQHIADV